MMVKRKNLYMYHLFAFLAICLLGFTIYWNTLDSPFVFDDFHNIRENPYIRISNFDLKGLYKAGVKSPASGRPFANASFAVNYYFGKYDVRGYHLVNICIHIINGFLVYLFSQVTFRRTQARVPPNGARALIPPAPNPAFIAASLFAALLFISHPIQVQSVTYIVQRMNSMAVMFFLRLAGGFWDAFELPAQLSVFTYYIPARVVLNAALPTDHILVLTGFFAFTAAAGLAIFNRKDI